MPRMLSSSPVVVDFNSLEGWLLSQRLQRKEGFTLGVDRARLRPMFVNYLQNLSAISMGSVNVLPSDLNDVGREDHVEFKVCLVSKPLSHAVFWNFCKLREKYHLLQIVWKMYNRTIDEFGFRMISWIIKPCACIICGATQTMILWYHAQPHPTIAYCHS